MFNANLSLTSSNISRFSFIKAGTKFIGTALSTFPRILIQAGILKLKHRLPHFKNNGFRSSFSSSRKQPSLFSKYCRKFVIQILKQIKNGSITLYYPSGESDTFGSFDKGSTHAIIHVSDYKLFNHLVLKGDIGLADAFIQSYWSTPNLEDVFSIFITNDRLIRPTNNMVKLFKFFLRVQHGLRRNSISKAKQNIYDHYDLGNSFFQLFLDKHRVYSSAMFSSENESLESAQLNKIKRIIEEADVKENHHLLEIGSGWGGLAIYAAETIGCKVTTVTISQEQYDFVKREINKRHLDHKIEVKLMDYRLLIGKYDRIVSIEMLEAVGHQYYSTFFDKCHDLLHRGGKAVFQCIMIPENRYNSYLKQPDFIQKYIFPGGHLPHLNLIKSKTKSSRFSWLNDYPITKHYVPTLNAWEDAFHQNADRIQELGFDKSFFNTWIYYFNYCSAGFKFDYIENHHFTIQKCH